MAQAAHHQAMAHTTESSPLDTLKEKSLRINRSILVFYPHFHGVERRNYLSARLMVFNVENGCIAFRDETGYYVTKIACFPEAVKVLIEAGFQKSWLEVMYAMGEYPATNPERERWAKIVSMAASVV